jgi:hypothetical protein
MAFLSLPQIPRKSPYYKLPPPVKGVHTLGVCPSKPSSRERYYVVVFMNFLIRRPQMQDDCWGGNPQVPSPLRKHPREPPDALSDL